MRFECYEKLFPGMRRGSNQGQTKKKCVITKTNGFLVSKETVVLHRWESETKIWFLSNELMKVESPQ